MKNITPLDAAQILKEEKSAILVDVRTYGEVAEESIPGAKHIPLDELPSRLDEVENFSTLLFLCRSGGRSAVAASIAESAKLSGVMNVTGGIIGWMSSGLPVVAGGKFSSGFAHKKTVVTGSIVALGLLAFIMIIADPLLRGTTAPVTPVDNSVSAGKFGTLTPLQFSRAIASKEANIIDVRTPNEYAYGHIANAQNIDFYDNRFRDNLNTLDKNKEYYIYCRSGHRSENSIITMRELGFTHVYDLRGGLVDWQNEGRPVDR